MNCPTCQASLRIAKTDITSEMGSTEVYANHLMVCVNPACAMHETNLNEPSKVVETLRNKMN
jgi:hypothetical protein